MIEKLIRIDSKPVRWCFIVNGKPVIVPTKWMMKYSRIRVAFFDYAETIYNVPSQKGLTAQKTWEAYLSNLMEDCEVHESPMSLPEDVKNEFFKSLGRKR